MADVSIVVPVKDEAGNAAALAREIDSALRANNDISTYEIVFVDDGSRDATVEELISARAEITRLRIVTHALSAGQSRAIRTGVKHAIYPLIVTLDGDGQNDPADIARLLAAFDGAPNSLGMVAGERVKREDKWSKRAASRFANRLRRWALDDKASDVGCGLKAFRREAFLALPYFDHMHRYLIALMQREAYEVRFVPVGHRPRGAGQSKYGVLDRLVVGISDLLGVMWLRRRSRAPSETKEI